MSYSGEYPKRIEGLTTNNYDVTRWMLADVEWPVFEEVARELHATMTDAAIDEAMHLMPPQWYAIDGAQLTKDLRQRRDGIVEYARKFYLHLADRVDVRATDKADLADVQHQPDGSLQLTLSPLDADGTAGEPVLPAPLLAQGDGRDPPVPARRQRQAGDQRQAGGRDPRARARRRRERHAGRLEERRRATSRTPRGATRSCAGRGRRSARREWTNPAPEKDRPWLEPRDYGHWTVPMVEMCWEPNQEFMIGGGLTRTAWGFRKYPWANMQSFTLLYSTGYKNVRASYLGQWRLSSTKLVGTLNMRFSGIENRNFFGFGNETEPIDDKTLYRTETNEFMVFPALSWRPSFTFELHVGAEAKGVRTKGGDSLVEQ